MQKHQTNITSEQWERALELFEVARALPINEREPFLTEQCADDRVVLIEVKALLDRDDPDDDFLDRPILGTAFDLASQDDDTLSEKSHYPPGHSIGQYTIKRVIGSGGMGVVYEAEQQFPTRRVALKVIRAGMYTHQSSHRFRYEVEVLGQLHHTNIAKIYDAGVHYEEGDVRRSAAAGLPYFVMEYIEEAQPIDEYVDENDLSLREIIALFTQVCDGVAHGHQKGIVHRDLKPGNILVGTDGVPRVIDFGVAKSTDADVAITTMRTEIGQLVGTVRYMSPEQCQEDVDRSTVDTRSDLYSLGVILYELVCGRLPYENTGSSVASCIHAVCYAEVVPPRIVSRRFRGDLEAVMLKGMERDPDKRYQSAGSMGDDLRRYLAGEPVAATTPSIFDIALRRIRRHPVAITAVFSLVVALMIVGSTYLSIQYVRNQPSYVTMDDERGAALYSVAGDPLIAWPRATAVALIDREEELGGGKVVVLVDPHEAGIRSNTVSIMRIGFGGRIIGKPNTVKQPRRPSNWSKQWDILDKPAQDEYFTVNSTLLIADFFPDDEHPGKEILTAWLHSPFDPSCIQIVDLQGEVLYRRWHKGHIADATWLQEEKVLVCAAVRKDISEEIIHAFNLDKKTLCRTVFAIRPRVAPNEEIPAILDADCEARDRPLWYKYIAPPEIWEKLPTMRFESPFTPHDRQAAKLVLWNGSKSQSTDEIATATIFINADGIRVQSAHVSNAYRYTDEGLPDPTTIQLFDYPLSLEELSEAYLK